MKFLKNKKRLIIIIVALVLICILAFPYIKAEYYTYKYGEQFEDLYLLTNMISDVEFYRVVEYADTRAKVYYVESGGLTTNYVYFIRENESEEWKMSQWETVWSKYGSASDAAWPYYFKDFIQ